MKKIKSISIDVRYLVKLGDIEVPDDVYEELQKVYDTGYPSEYVNALDWLRDNVTEDKSFGFPEYEICNLDSEEDDGWMDYSAWKVS